MNINKLSKYFLKLSGLFLPPENLLKRIEDFVIQSWLQQVYVHNLEKQKENLTPKEEKEIEKILELCKKYKVAIRSEQFEFFEENFNIDQSNLKNWNIGNKDNLHNFQFQLTVQLDLLYNISPKIIWKDINVEEAILEIGLRPDIFEFDQVKSLIIYLKEVVNHEIIHVSQALFKHLKNLNDLGGLPKQKSIRSLKKRKYDSFGNEINEDGKIQVTQEHSLRDVEFYARLNDEINIFLNYIKRIPKNIRHEYLKCFLNLPNKFNIKSNRYKEPSEFFKELYDGNMKKYKQVVKEFYKAVKEKIE